MSISNKQNSYMLLVGTYTKEQSDGIYTLKFHADSGALEVLRHTRLVDNPSYLCLSKNKQFVYAVNESGHPDGDSVSAFQLNATTGELFFLNAVNTRGIHPCYVSTDNAGKHVFVANYTSGNLSVYDIESDGALSELKQSITHSGSSINKERQASPHIHATVLSNDEQFLFASDLGTDEIVTYQFNTDSALIEYTRTKVKAGTGPRHLVFNTSGTRAYLTLEMSGEVAVFEHKAGSLLEVQTISLEDISFSGTHSAADIHISAVGDYLYASNRGASNTLSVFKIDSENGHLSFVERQSVNGLTPRNFVIDPSGNYLLVANQDSNNITVFKRNIHSGSLKLISDTFELDAPVCLKFIV
jgi:6-phosphogluconolactonase